MRYEPCGESSAMCCRDPTEQHTQTIIFVEQSENSIFYIFWGSNKMGPYRIFFFMFEDLDKPFNQMFSTSDEYLKHSILVLKYLTDEVETCTNIYYKHH